MYSFAADEQCGRVFDNDRRGLSCGYDCTVNRIKYCVRENMISEFLNFYCSSSTTSDVSMTQLHVCTATRGGKSMGVASR